MTAQYLTKAPLDFSNPAVQELRSVLLNAYPRTNQVIDLVQQAGGELGLINLEQAGTYLWGDVLKVLCNQGKLVTLLDIVMAGPLANVAVRVKELTDDNPVVAAPATGVKADWSAGPVPDGGYEKLIAGTSTLLDIAFLQRGVELAPAVVRLLVTLDGENFHGTAFRIGERRFLTNHHVLYADSGAAATKAEAWFGYERVFGGATKAHTSLDGDVATIHGDPAHDWAVIDLMDDIPAGVPVIPLATPDRVVAPEDRVYIIQHPGGGVKKIGMVHNVVRSVTHDVVTYWTDTEEGSSGSPVFNELWQLVGLHHYWTRVTIGGATETRNQGRRIERVAEAIAAAGLG